MIGLIALLTGLGCSFGAVEISQRAGEERPYDRDWRRLRVLSLMLMLFGALFLIWGGALLVEATYP